MTAAAVFNNRHLTHKNQIPVLISGLCFATTTHPTPLHPTPPHARRTPPHHPQPGQGRALGPDRTLGPGPGRRSYLRIVLCSRSYLRFVLCSSSIYSKNPGKSTIRRYDPGPARDPKYDPEIRSRAGRGPKVRFGDTIQGRSRTWRYDLAPAPVPKLRSGPRVSSPHPWSREFVAASFLPTFHILPCLAALHPCNLPHKQHSALSSCCLARTFSSGFRTVKQLRKAWDFRLVQVKTQF